MILFKGLQKMGVPKMDKAFYYLKERLFFGTIMRLLIEGYIDLAISSQISISLAIENNKVNLVDIIFSSIMLLITLTGPFISLWFLFKYSPKLEENDFKTRFDSLYSEFNLQKGLKAKLFIGFFFLRRLLIAFVATLLIDCPGI
jgi:hypothetical protein